MDKTTREIYDKWLNIKPQSNQLKERIARRFMLEFNYNSNHIEGNALTYGQTELLLLFGKISGDVKMKDLEEMKAHNVGLQMVKEEALRKDKPLTEMFIRQLHQVLFRDDYKVHRRQPNGTTHSYTVHVGCYKTRQNSVITQTGEHFEYASPEETPALMNELVLWYNTAANNQTLNAIELAALFHYRYIRIHPFEDGNGRIARLLVNFILYRFGYPMIVVPSKTKNEYLSVLNRCDTNVGSVPIDGANADVCQIAPFVKYIEKLIVTEMQYDISIITGEDHLQWWYNGEVVRFQNNNVNILLKTITENPHISIRDLSNELNINKSAIQRHIKILQDKGYLVRIGSVTRGEWHVVLSQL